jgi:hypothetical protein
LGYDDPFQIQPTAPTGIPLVEAPIAADEIIHMHWRWGSSNPRRAGTHAKHFMGWSDEPNSKANETVERP